MDSKNFILSGMKILVIDDEPDILDLTKCLLTFYHANVIAAATAAAEELEQVQTHRPDVIVSDIGMPQRDGYQFIREVRNLPAHNSGQTPAIALVEHAKAIPPRFAAKSGPSNRVGRIFIDYLRNGLGATTAYAWSARARPGLGGSVPLACQWTI
jgi:CheY-like chemotaxis protein